MRLPRPGERFARAARCAPPRIERRSGSGETVTQPLHDDRRWLRFLEQDPQSRLRLPANFAQFVDHGWAEDSRAAFADYLDNGHAALVIRVRPQNCPLCGDELHPASYRSDGYLLWPSYLGHFVRAHGVKLPATFVEHITKNGFKPSPAPAARPLATTPRRPALTLRESLR